MFKDCATGCTVISIVCVLFLSFQKPVRFFCLTKKINFSLTEVFLLLLILTAAIMRDTDFANNKELLLQLQQHNEQALAMLMKAHYNDLYNYASRFASDEALVKDTIQEVFISLWQHRETASSILSLRYYLLAAVKNRMIKALQKKKNSPDTIADAEHYHFEAEFSIEKKIIEKQLAQERAENVQSIISRLSARQREIIYLKFYQQMDHSQIAGLMNISQQSVYNLLHESIQKFKKSWQSEFLMKAC